MALRLRRRRTFWKLASWLRPRVEVQRDNATTAWHGCWTMEESES
jgi:hypothetical protein